MRCTLVTTGAPLTRRAPDLADALLQAGYMVDYLATPSADAWLDADSLYERGVHPRASRPGQPGPRQALPDLAVVCPATFNTINKLAAGIADTHAHSFLCELMAAGIPTTIVPMINDRLWNHPALGRSLASLSVIEGWRFINPRDFGADLSPIESGTGNDVVEKFDVRRLVTLLTA